MVNDDTNDRDFTVGTSSKNSAIIKNALNVKFLERCFNEKIDRETSNIIDTVEARSQTAILTAINSIVAPKIEWAIRPINASSGRDVTRRVANSELGKHLGINASFENASENSNVRNGNDETRNDIPNEVNELSVPGTRFDRQTHTHHSHTFHTRRRTFS